MASIHRSQLRLHQLTGSLNSAQAAQASLNAPSMQLVMDHLASGMFNVAGQSFHNITRSTLKDEGGADRITFVKDAKLLLSGGSDAVDSVDIDTRLGGILLDQGAASKKIHLDAAGSVDVDGDAGVTIDSSGGAIAIGGENNTGAINIGTAGQREVTVGASAANSAGVTIIGNTGGIDIDCSQGTGALSLDTAGGAIEIGVNAAAGAINIGTNATARTVTIGNATGASALDLDSGTGGVTINSTGTGNIAIDSDNTLLLDSDGVLELNSSAGAINIGNDDDNGAIGIGTDGTRTITIGEDGQNDKTLNVHASAANIVLDAGSNNVAVTGGLTVSGNTVLSGDLTVNGSTTTVSSSNTIIADRIIALASGTLNQDSDAGLVFTRFSANLGGGGDKRNGALLFDGGSGGGNIFKLGVTNDTGESTSLTVANDDLADLYVGKLLIDSNADHIDVSTDLTITAAADIKLTPGGGQVVPGSNNAIGLGIKSTAEFADLFLGQDANIGFNNDNLKLVHQNATNSLLLSSSLSRLDLGDNKVAVMNAGAGANTLKLRSNSRDYLFAGQAFLQNGVLTDIDGAGTLEFRDASADTQKVASGIFSAIASGSAPGSYTLLDKPIGFVDPLFLVNSQLPAQDVSKRVDVFVNGQMLISGSGAEVGAGAADYVIRHPTVATIVVTKAVRNNAVSDGGNLSLTCGANAAGGGFNNNTGLTVAIAQNDSQSQIATKILTQLRDSGGSGGGLTADQCFIPAAALDTVVFLNRASLGTLAVVQTDIIYADASSDGMTITQNAARVSPQMAFDLEVDDTVAILVR